jgi:hypothetical protein
MEKFNQAPTPAKVESETEAAVAESTETVETVSGAETAEEFTSPPGAFMNEVPSSPESVPESPSEKLTRLRQQKSAATDHLNSEFWPDELDEASTYRLRNLLAQSQGKEQADDDFEFSIRAKQAVDIGRQIDDLDSEILKTYEQSPEELTERYREIIRENIDLADLADASYFQDPSLPMNKLANLRGEAGVEFRDIDRAYYKIYGEHIYKNSIYEPQPYGFSNPLFEEEVSSMIEERREDIDNFDRDASQQEQSEDFDKQTVREKLSYQDADLPPEQLEAMLRDAEGRETAEKYAHHLNKLSQEEIHSVLPSIKGQAKKVLDILGIPISPYGKSDSWAYWDLGKQQYYYELNKDSEPKENDPYTYAPALEKLDEISDRHIGWEFYHAPTETREQAFQAIEDPYCLAKVFEVLQNDPKADGQLASHEYAELGKVLREYARSKDSQDNIDDMLAVQREANYEGNDSELLFDRLDNPKILDQIVQMWMAGYKAKEGKIEQRPTQDEDGGIVFDSDGNYVLQDVTFVPPSEEKPREKIAELIKEAKTSTPVFFDGRAPTSEGIGLDWKLPGDVVPSTKQKSIILAHEKGHLMRQFPGGVEGDAYFREVFGKAFNMNNINFTEQDFEDTVAHRKQEKQVTGYGLEDEDYTYDRMRESTIGYLSSPEEIVERMGQLKNYFGFKSDEEFTQEHLDYARGQYVKDTGLDNNMRHFFESITDDQEFLRLINSVGV